MANIRRVKNKSLGVIKTVFRKLESLNLKQYYFECAIILLKAIVRPSILYSCEAYYDLKENELRQIERIEESFLRKLLKTTKGCTITQLYLEVGVYPARFEIQRLRLLYLRYILDQNEESYVKRMFHLQLENPKRGDWASTCIKDLKELGVNKSFEEIGAMTKPQYSTLIKGKIQEKAFNYLNGKRGSKGKEIVYKNLSMAEYLLPWNRSLSNEQKLQVFAIRNRMIDLPCNFPINDDKVRCSCGEIETMEHIYNSNSNSGEILFDKNYNGTYYNGDRRSIKKF